VTSALGLGVPVVSNSGPLTEPIWRARSAVQLSLSLERVAPEVLALLADPERRAKVGRAGRTFYEEALSIDRAVDVLSELSRRDRGGGTA
jgi:hypothetical protein